ncbi:hypothetical protein ERC79_03080 [Rhodococcus sp. ABRD24]|uniref:hypothetical protein n=1 Tax=Rhodococcus sp. ABRD24 TaxID=2507582 RepID=UPI0010401A79|nr:hypothetical protein [Rhodococcus sp. ABRD24]QBJ98516.1 hypothetical protein ERC79_03080 [Rhodococcus sp. ABRD24]
MDVEHGVVGAESKERRPAPRWWRLAIGGIVPALTVATCLWIIWSFVPPSGSVPAFVLGEWALLVLGGIWSVLVAVGLVRYGWHRLVLVAPVIVVLTAALVAFSVPERFGWWMSKDDLLRAAVACVDPPESDHIGLYEVLWVDRVGERGCRFHTSGGFLDLVGVAYLPGMQPYIGDVRHDGDIGYRHLEGDWYSFTQRF